MKYEQIWKKIREINVRKFLNFSATQILREINFGHFWVPKTAILTIWAGLNLEILDTFDIVKCEIAKSGYAQNENVMVLPFFHI